MTYESDIPMRLAISAYSGTSFSPERRAESAISEYAQTLATDLVQMQEHASKGKTLDMVAEQFAHYREGLRISYTAWLSSSARCVSSMIAGPSNFPAHRMNKRADIAHRRLGGYLEYRKTALAAIVRNLRPDLRPIMAGDDNATTRLVAEIGKLEAVQERMKAANLAIRKTKKDGPDAQIAALVALGFPVDRAAGLLKPDFCGRIGFANYALTNNSANLRRIKARLVTVSAAKEKPDSTIEGKNATIDDCPADNRVRLTFPGKPVDTVRSTLKSNGFRWTPSLGVWQAYRNQNTLQIATQLACAPGH